MISTTELAEKVRTVRALQNSYYRMPKEPKEAKLQALKNSKAAEADLDKIVDSILNPTDGR